MVEGSSSEQTVSSLQPRGGVVEGDCQLQKDQVSSREIGVDKCECTRSNTTSNCVYMAHMVYMEHLVITLG